MVFFFVFLVGQRYEEFSLFYLFFTTYFCRGEFGVVFSRYPSSTKNFINLSLSLECFVALICTRILRLFLGIKQNFCLSDKLSLVFKLVPKLVSKLVFKLNCYNR